MKIPRDLSGSDLIKLLREFGYEPTRQAGSHIRITTQQNGEHHVTIPNHSPLKIGTLSSILSEVAAHLGKTKDELIKQLFG
jgi:predicted RNA binding protein YcfA (HicA-like mRNA interferase family)